MNKDCSEKGSLFCIEYLKNEPINRHNNLRNFPLID